MTGGAKVHWKAARGGDPEGIDLLADPRMFGWPCCREVEELEAAFAEELRRFHGVLGSEAEQPEA